MNTEKWKRFLLTALLAAVGSILIGLLLFQNGIFDKNRIGFQFLSFGIIGGILFSSFRFLKKWVAAIVVVVLLVLDEAVLHTGNWNFVWQDILYYLGVCAAIFVFAEYYFPRHAGTVLSRLLILSSLLAVSYIVVAVVLYLIFQANPAVPRFNLAQMIYYDLAQGFLVGFGLGAGIEGAEFVLKRTTRSAE